MLLAAVAAACVALGFWQIERAEASRSTAERFAAAARLPALDAPPDVPVDEIRYRRLEVRGRYVPERQFLVDNVVRDGVAGYYVLTPFSPAGGGRWLIVNRGWVEADPDRSVLPEVRVPSAERQVEGLVDSLPAPGLRLGDPAPPPAGASVAVVSYPTMADLEQALGRPLLDYQLLLDPSAPDGFERVWTVRVMSPARHIGYAVQWWLFAAIAAGAACAVGWRGLRRRHR